MVVNPSNFRVKPNLGYVRLRLSWGFDNLDLGRSSLLTLTLAVGGLNRMFEAQTRRRIAVAPAKPVLK